MTERDERFETRRRNVLASVGLLTGVGTLPLVNGERTDAEDKYALVQGDRCIPVTPLSGSDSVETFYDYRLPERYVSEENGGRTGSRPHFSSVGTGDLQRADTSVLFLYDGPNGLSLVVVHGRVDDASGGGSATFRITGLPSDGHWVVKDDIYRDPETGELAETNYDRWAVDGDAHTINWTWGANTDGGAFRDLGADPTVTIEPAFNEAATLFGEHYEGRVDEWYLLTADGDALRRVSLDMATPVEIREGDCSTSDGTPSSADTQTRTDPEPDDAETGGETDGTQEESQQRTDENQQKQQTKHEKKQEKHRKRNQKHEKKQRKHEKKQQKHEKKQRKHRKKNRKHEKKQKKHRKKQRKHRKKQRKHEKKQRKHEK